MAETTSQVATATQDSLASASGIAEYEGLLRQIYAKADAAIAAEAKHMLSKGADPGAVATWANRARNMVKTQIRNWDLAVLRKMAEQRNLLKYGNSTGPSYRQLRQAGKTDLQIIEGAGKSNPTVNRWVGRFRVAGHIMIAVEIGFIAYEVANAPDVARPRVLLEGAGGLAGAVAGGLAGAKICSAVGAALGAPAAGVGAVPGAAAGAIVCGIGGGIAGAFGGRAIGAWTAEQLYPVEETCFEGDFALEN